MMYRNSQKVHMNATDTRMQRRILAALCLVFLITTIFFGVTAVRNAVYQKNARTQFNQRMLSAASSAIDEVNRMAGMVTSNTASRLAKVRQYVYLMDQLNAISIALSGEGGRLAPAEAFTALYSDLDAMEALMQTATASTLDSRTVLLAHLTYLKDCLTGD
ncbi:MAG: hypothetical protein MR400_08050 [Clostridiales bacterium]|nr:hypothetical protein [Clostridiales bacterium]